MKDYKRCYQCKLTKPKTSFYRDRNQPSRLQKRCKDCSKANSKKQYRQNPERIAWRRLVSRFKDGKDGIKLDERWLNFDSFLLDVGKKPADGYRLTHIDKERNVAPGNLYWIKKITK